jgi:hypothetical protein
MIYLNVLFWIFVLLFALIGMNRGWAKEMLVSFAVVLAIFIITVMEVFFPPVASLALVGPPKTLFYIRSLFLLALVLFGYQGPNIPKLAASNRFVRERLQDWLLGLFIGALNGYLIVGTLWYFLDFANYPFPEILRPPLEGPEGEPARYLISMLPPHWLHAPTIYFAVAIAFAFVLVVFI